MWKKMIFRALKAIAIWSAKKLYNYIDKDGNNELSQKEIWILLM